MAFNLWKVALLMSTCFIGQLRCDGDHSHVHSVDSIQTSSTSASGDTSNYAAIAKALEDNPALAAYAASALQGQPGGAYDLPPPPVAAPVGFAPPFGFGKGFNFNLDAGAGIDAAGGVGVAIVIVKKIIVVVGAAILILIILAFLQGSLLPGGFLNTLGGSFSKAVAGSTSVNAGPLSASAAGAAGLNLNDRVGVNGQRPNDPSFNAGVNDAINRRF